MTGETALRFRNGAFTVLQVSDTQDLQNPRRAMLWMLNRAYDRVKPDLVLLTGDNILGNHLRDATLLSRLTVRTPAQEYRAMKKALSYVLEPLEARGIPFAMIYGNHDDMNAVSKAAQARLFRAYHGCVGLDGEKNGLDCDTYVLQVLSEDGKRAAFRLWMLDSAWTDKEQKRGYCRIKPEAVRWYEAESRALTHENGGVPVPALMFRHVPPIQTLRLIEPCEKTKGAVCENGVYYRLKPGVTGVMGEYPSVTDDEAGLFEAIKRCADVQGVVSGHDHLNCFTATLDGIKLIQTAAASFRCYGGPIRGVRVFRLFEDGRWETEYLSYFDLCGKTPVSALRYFWDADDMVKQKIASLAAVGLVAGGAAFALRKRARGRR